MSCLLAAPLAAQRPLDRFTYDNLRFTGVWAETGIATSDRLKGTAAYGLRIDFGQFAPRLRMLVGGSYSRSDFKQKEIDQFETKLRNVVNDPTDDFSIDLGKISWSDVALDVDLQYMLVQGRSYQPYLGAGAGMHIRNGSGRAINGTFVEDALDMVGAGINFTAGLDFLLTRGLVMNLGGRAVVGSDLNTITLSVGIGYRR
ncbi:MAG: hypothetical protein ABI836_16245 [Gemmatimonadota bacterium]